MEHDFDLFDFLLNDPGERPGPDPGRRPSAPLGPRAPSAPPPPTVEAERTQPAHEGLDDELMDEGGADGRLAGADGPPTAAAPPAMLALVDPSPTGPGPAEQAALEEYLVGQPGRPSWPGWNPNGAEDRGIGPVDEPGPGQVTEAQAEAEAADSFAGSWPASDEAGSSPWAAPSTPSSLVDPPARALWPPPAADAVPFDLPAPEDAGGAEVTGPAEPDTDPRPWAAPTSDPTPVSRFAAGLDDDLLPLGKRRRSTT